MPPAPQILRVAVNALNKQFRITEKVWSSTPGCGREADDKITESYTGFGASLGRRRQHWRMGMGL